MRKCSSHKPALVRYFPLVVFWIVRAWDLYRLYEKVEALVEVIIG